MAQSNEQMRTEKNEDWESMLKTCAMAEDYHDKVAIQVINTIQSFQQRAVLIQYVADSNNNWHS